MKKNTFFAIILLLLPFWVSSQEKADAFAVSGSYIQASLTDILRDLENRLPLRFFAPSGSLPAGAFTKNYDRTPIAAVLDDLLSGTTLSYLIYRDYAVVIGERSIIEQAYNAGFYTSLEQNKNREPAADGEPVLVIGDRNRRAPGRRATLSGVIRDAASGEPLMGVTTYFPAQETGTITDESGAFSIELPVGLHEMVIRNLGYEELKRRLEIFSTGRIELSLNKGAIALEEVVVMGRGADANVGQTQIGLARLDLKSLQRLPSFMGEADVVQGLLQQPGISRVGEGATGFNVRGGNVDQNLIMQDGAILFNSSHALGFFSLFNPDLINTVALHKSIMPAQFGGRLAGVLDVDMRNGNFGRLGLKGGISPVSARLSVETPVIKDKSSVLVGARMAYSDWILRTVRIPEVNKSSASFYDINLNYTHKLGDKNTLTIAGSLAQDEFGYSDEFGFSYGTASAILRLRSLINQSLLSNFTVVYSDYTSRQDEYSGVTGSRLDTDIRYVKLQEQLTYSPTKDLTFDGGLASVFYQVQPGTIRPLGPASTVTGISLEQEQALESAAFINGDWTVSSRLSLSAGLRLVFYQYLGPQTVQQYAGDPRDDPSPTDTISYDPGQSIAGYNSLEPRFSLRYRLNAATSIKAGYSRTAQFINQIFNTDTPTPTSLWQLSTGYIRPQRSHNSSLGLFRNFSGNTWESSAEIYYRWIDELFDFRDFAELTGNENLETELLAGEGRAYGLELSLRKKSGVLTGWLSYTYSRTERQIQGINAGAWYPANFDQPHDFSLVTELQFNQRHRISMQFSYNTGRPTTAPFGSYLLPSGLRVPDYSGRNQIRIPDYHRLDLAYTIGQTPRKAAKFRTSWTFSVYNLYGRRNPFSVYFLNKTPQIIGTRRLAILGSAFPSLTFNFELI